MYVIKALFSSALSFLYITFTGFYSEFRNGIIFRNVGSRSLITSVTKNRLLRCFDLLFQNLKKWKYEKQKKAFHVFYEKKQKQNNV